MTNRYDARRRKIERERLIAAALRASGNEALPASRETSGRFDAPVAWQEHASKALDQILGGLTDRQANKSEQKLEAEQSAAQKAWIDQLDEAQTPDEVQPIAPEHALIEPPTMDETLRAKLSQLEPRAPSNSLPGLSAPAATGSMDDTLKAKMAEMQAAEQQPAQPDPAEVFQRQTARQLSAADTYNRAADASMSADRKRLLGHAIKGFDVGGVPNAIGEQILAQLFNPKTPDDFTLNEGDTRHRGRTGQIIARGQPKAVKEDPTDRMLINVVDPTSKSGYRTIKRADWKGEQEYQKPSASGEMTSGTDYNDPEYIDYATRLVLQDPANMRQFASFGKAGQVVRDKINANSAKMLKAAGMSVNDLNTARARSKGEVKSTSKMVDQLNLITAYEKLAEFNGARLLELVNGVDETGIPAVEGFIRKAKRLGGNVDTAEFQSVLQTYQTEAARIINNPNLTGVLSDTARQEMQAVVDGRASAPQLRRVVNRLNLEMGVRRTALEQQIAVSGGAMQVVPNAPGGPTAAPRPGVVTPSSDADLLNKWGK